MADFQICFSVPLKVYCEINKSSFGKVFGNFIFILNSANAKNRSIICK